MPYVFTQAKNINMCMKHILNINCLESVAATEYSYDSHLKH